MSAARQEKPAPEYTADAAGLRDLAGRFALYAAVARARAAALASDGSAAARRECVTLKRQAWAYHEGALRATAVPAARSGWLLAYLAERAGEPVTGACYAAMAADVRDYLAARG